MFSSKMDSVKRPRTEDDRWASESLTQRSKNPLPVFWPGHFDEQ